MQEYEKRYHQIRWFGVIGILVCGIIIGILVNAATGNADAARLSAAVTMALGIVSLMYAMRQMRIKHGIIVQDERLVNLHYKAMANAVRIFLLCAVVLCFGVWFAELFEIGKLNVAVPFTDVLAYVICIILVAYLVLYFYYQRKM